MTPTRVRYGMIAATTGVAVMLYLDRVCLSILSEQVKPLLGDSPEERTRRFATLTGAFFWTYALFQLPAGWLGDRFGARVVLPVYLFLWSLCTGLIGLADGFVAFFVLRLGCGLFEAGAYPLAAGVVRTWMPPGVRGLASGCVSVGGRLGGAVAPVLTVALAGTANAAAFGSVIGGPGMIPFADGWRTPFFVYGLVGIVGAVPFWFWYRNRPSEHPVVNAAEAELIAAGRTAPTTPHGLPPVGAFVRSSAMWLNSLVQFLANFAWVFIITLFPAYLKQAFDTPERDRAFFQLLPLLAGIGGMLLGGWLSDRAVRRFGLRWGRGLPVAGSRLLVGAAYLGCLAAGDAATVAALMCVVAFATDMGVAPVWAWAQDVGGRHTGAVIGWANMWGNFGAAVSPDVLNNVVAGFGDEVSAGWRAAFLLCAGVQVVAAVAALGIDARRPIGEASV